PSLRAERTSRAPSLAKSRAMPAPMPRLAPVTSTTFPSRSIELHPVPGEDLPRLPQTIHSEDVIGIQHQVEGAFERCDQGHVPDGVPLLDRIVGEFVRDVRHRDAESLAETRLEFLLVHEPPFESGDACVGG